MRVFLFYSRLAVFCVLLCVINHVYSRTILVPKEYAEIQDAIDNARDGDTVFVANGVYSGALRLRNKIWLIGENREKTVLWGKQHRPVIIGAHHTVVKNLTIKGGSKGIVCENVIMRIEENIICENVESGIHCLVSLPVIRNNVICRNKWSGIFCESARSITAAIEHNVIAENEYSGLFMAGRTEVLVQNNMFFRNYQYGIWADKDSRRTRIVYNNFFDNRNQHNADAPVDHTNVSVDPAYDMVPPGAYNYLKTRAPQLKGIGKDGKDIGLFVEKEFRQTQSDVDRDDTPNRGNSTPDVSDDPGNTRE